MRTYSMILAASLAACLPASALAGNDDNRLSARLQPFNEVPSVSSVARGRFEAKIINETQIDFTLTYSDLEGATTQAHIHFGQRDVNGAIMVFLCSNLGNGPAGTQVCPTPGGTVSGSLTAATMVNSAGGQGIAAGEFAEMLKAIRAGVAYANVHSTKFPGGEVRGQIKSDD